MFLFLDLLQSDQEVSNFKTSSSEILFKKIKYLLILVYMG